MSKGRSKLTTACSPLAAASSRPLGRRSLAGNGFDLELHSFMSLKTSNDRKQVLGTRISGWTKHAH